MRGNARPVRRGFTLIELTAVLALAAILTGTAAVSVGAYQRRGALRDAAEQLRWADATVRAQASGLGVRRELSIDLATGRLSRGSPDVVDAASIAELPRGVRATAVVVADRRSGYGHVEVSFSAIGLGPSYAVLLEGPARRREWVVFTGLTGQSIVLPDDPSTDAILRSPAFAGRPDAD